MVFRKKRFRRRTGRRRRFRRSRRGIRRIVRSMAETKYFIQQIVNANWNAALASNYTITNGLAQGTTARTRIGQQIRAKRISIRATATLTYQAGGTTGCNLRFALVAPRKANSTNTLSTNLTQANPGFTNTFEPEYCMVLWDKTMRIDIEPAAGNNYAERRYIRVSKPLRWVFNYSPGTNNVERAPILYIATDRNALDTTVLSMSVETRLSFKDV